MKKIILVVGIVFLFSSILYAQSQTIKTTSKGGSAGGSSMSSSGTTSQGKTSTSGSTAQTTQKQKEAYDLEVNDLYLDKDNKICVALKLLEGNIPQADFRTIKLSLKASSLGNIPDIELSRFDPQGELNSRKKKDFNSGIVLKSIDTVSCDLTNITDKNLKNNSLKERLTPRISLVTSEKTAPVKPSGLPSGTKVAKTTVPSRLPSAKVDTGLSGARVGVTQRTLTSEGNLAPISNQPQQEGALPEVLNILYYLLSLTTPQYQEVSLERRQDTIALQDTMLRLDWNIFGIQNFKQLTIKIVYIDDTGQERRIDEFSYGLNDPPFYEKNYTEIFNYLIRNRWISEIESWKTYHFRITGSVIIEEPSTQSNLNVGSGIQVASTTAGSTSRGRVIPTNSFDLYYFIKGEENTSLQLPASEYQRVQAGIYIHPEPKNTEGKFKMELGGYDILSKLGKQDYWHNDCSLRIFVSNFYLIIEDALDLTKKCSVNIIQKFGTDRFIPHYDNIAGKAIGICRRSTYPDTENSDGVLANFSLLNDFLNLPDCKRTFSNPQGKTFRVWAYADAQLQRRKPAKKCEICQERNCKYGQEETRENYFVYSPTEYLTLYNPQDIPPPEQTPEPQNLSTFKPQSLILNHPLTTINITPEGGEVASRVQGASINTITPLSVSYRENLSLETIIYFILERFTNRGWQEAEAIEYPVVEGESSILLPTSSSRNRNVVGGFERGSYRLCHYYQLGPYRSQRSDWVYFQVVPTVTQRVALRLSDLRATPTRNQRSLSFRIKNISSYELSDEYVNGVDVEVIQTTRQGVVLRKSYRVPTPIPGVSSTQRETSGLASQGILIELPQDFDLPTTEDGSIIRTEVKLKIADTEFWSGDEITAVFGDVLD
ncbi:MAG: hypothetical protein NC900_05315 [Candidatus Omnitrophica bacterium]|nr:hypothetical protein [Candidatus Omnitrophota bacterium]